MFKRFAPTLLLPIFLSGCGRTPATETPEATEQTFTFDSVAYTSGGKAQTSKFKPKSAVIGGKIVELPGSVVQIRADAVKNEIVIQGSYGPGELTLTAIKVPIYAEKHLDDHVLDPRIYPASPAVKVRDITLVPQSKDGKWSAAIPADTLKTNKGYGLIPVVNGSDDNTASVDLSIAGN